VGEETSTLREVSVAQPVRKPTKIIERESVRTGDFIILNFQLVEGV
jgi:hypothetical protein